MDHLIGLPSPPDSATSESTPSSSSGSSNSKTTTSPTGPYLEGLSRSILTIMLNHKDMAHPLILRHLASGFRSKHDALPQVSTREDHQQSLQTHLASQPDFHVEVLNASSEVDDSRGRATVFLWYGLSGVDHGLEREAVAVLSWERRQGLWQIVKHTGMRGPSGFW